MANPTTESRRRPTVVAASAGLDAAPPPRPPRRPAPRAGASVTPATILLDFRLYGAWDRGIVQGITESGREHNWNLVLASADVPLADMAATWHAAAVVTGCPERLPPGGGIDGALTVAVGRDFSGRGVPSICPDDSAVGRLAAKHLLRTGLRDTAVFAYEDAAFARDRASGFRQEIEAAGGVCHPGGEFSNKPDTPNFCGHETIIRWLKSLPRPCGLFAICDNWAGPIATYCRHLGLRVPEDVALIGVDNDPLVCELSAPPLSSVSVPWREIGHRVVRMIEAHLAGRPVPVTCARVLPVDVVARRSTDTLSIDDDLVAAAVAWIRRNAANVIGVDDVTRAIPTYRQRLERQFRAGLGRTVMEEIRRAHVDLARSLLATTELTMPEIAARSGFTNATILGINFRKELGLTPSQYRRRARGDRLDTPRVRTAAMGGA